MLACAGMPAHKRASSSVPRTDTPLCASETRSVSDESRTDTDPDDEISVRDDRSVPTATSTGCRVTVSPASDIRRPRAASSVAVSGWIVTRSPLSESDACHTRRTSPLSRKPQRKKQKHR